MPGKGRHPLVVLARQSVETYIKQHKRMRPPAELTPEMEEKAGVFVCLKSGGTLRGCIGTFVPTTANVAEEVIRNAVCAAVEDPRFRCVTKEELDGIDYTVDVLTVPEPVKNMRELDPKVYGVIVQAGERRGLLLPDLDGVDTVEEQIMIAKSKAGIDLTEPVTVYKFEVRRYE